MKGTSFRTALLAGRQAAAAAVIAGAPLAASATSYDWSQLSALVNSYCCSSQISSNWTARMAFIAANGAGPGAPLYATAGGDESLNTLLMIDSASKLPAATVILEAVYAHGYTKSSTVSTIVGNYVKATGNQDAKSFLDHWNGAVNDSWSHKSITIGQLLSMTSGIITLGDPSPVGFPAGSLHHDPNDGTDPNHVPDAAHAFGGTRPYCLDGSNVGVDPYDPKDVFMSYTLAQCADQIAQLNLSFQPGSKFGYGSASYQIAGYVATLLNGTPGDWLRLFNSSFVAPLGLANAGSSYSFTYNDDQYIILNPYNRSPAVSNPRISGGAASTALAYSRFLTAILNDGVYNGQQVIPTTIVSLLETNQLPATFMAGYDATTGTVSNRDYGLAPYQSTRSDNPCYFAPASPSHLQGYSFGLLIPTKNGNKIDYGTAVPANQCESDAYYNRPTSTPLTSGFFSFLHTGGLPTSPVANTLLAKDLKLPSNAAKIFIDPGLNGSIGWINIASGSADQNMTKYSGVIIQNQWPQDASAVGIDILRQASSAISCQLLQPGHVEPYPGPIVGSNPAAYYFPPQAGWPSANQSYEYPPTSSPATFCY